MGGERQYENEVFCPIWYALLGHCTCMCLPHSELVAETSKLSKTHAKIKNGSNLDQ